MEIKMSMYYNLVCLRCHKQLPVFRNGNHFDADPDNLMIFIMEHEEHDIILLNEHKADSYCIENIVPMEWR